MKQENSRKILRIITIMLLDLLFMAASGGVAMLVRFEFSVAAIPAEHAATLVRFLPVQFVITLIIFWLRKMYHYVWRSVSVHDVVDMILSSLMAFIASYVVARIFSLRLPTSVAFIDALCVTVTQVGMRCFLRFYQVILRSYLGERGDEQILVIGAGEAGRMLLRELVSGKNRMGKVRCIIDDNKSKWGKQMDGVPVVGGRRKIAWAVREYNITQIIFAIPSASASTKKEILNLCQETGCRVKSVPGMYQMINGEFSLSDIKDVQVEDLLGRDPVELDSVAIGHFLRGRTVLVTGGGGSIGSELCRQIAGYRPWQLIILDIYENNAYDIQQELLSKFPGLNLKVEIASVRDKTRIYEIFEYYRPEVVFHAAAHKHVPLMEHCPKEAIKNNIFGTYHVVRAAEKYGTAKFVMISTDKAVNPTNIMGATKRYCEMILQSRDQSSTEFCAVRFGNVLGSNGSVVPLFKKQIEAGGPVTLTDKRIIRYFMTIPEAAQLVLEAGAMAHRGQIFVLDMGEPVKILTLAENLIRLSGLEPYKDIEIREIGLRPGEKLYEELLTKSETLTRTANEKIFVEQQEHIDPKQIWNELKLLDEAVTGDCSQEELTLLMKKVVPTFYSPDEINGAVGSACAPDLHDEEDCFAVGTLQSISK